jgi:hypothetical protein
VPKDVTYAVDKTMLNKLAKKQTDAENVVSNMSQNIYSDNIPILK